MLKPIAIPTDNISSRLKESSPLIQIILGPRQVGKTTAVDLILSKNKTLKAHFVNGDGISSENWILEQWQKAALDQKILIIDEIQKIPSWSESVKKLWDESRRKKNKIKCLFLGSSSLSLQKGLSESLTGRFEVIPFYHWDYQQSIKLKKMSLDEYLIFGGYPGSYTFINETERWIDYLRSSIVETVIGKDILTQAKVKSPALLRQCFYLVASFPAQYISYNKLLGQLQDKGNIDLVKYYLELLESAFLIKKIFKYSKNELQKKQSSPKIITMAPALNTFHRMDNLNAEYMGRVFESLVGAQLVKAKANLYYWQEGDYEVDYILEYKGSTIALEVKSGRNKRSKSLEKFLNKYPKTKVVFIDKDNYARFEKDCLGFIEALL